MKIICEDNYGRETVNDILIAENVKKHYAIKIAEFLNRDTHELGPYFYRAVDNEYKLHKWEPWNQESKFQLDFISQLLKI